MSITTVESAALTRTWSISDRSRPLLEYQVQLSLGSDPWQTPGVWTRYPKISEGRPPPRSPSIFCWASLYNRLELTVEGGFALGLSVLVWFFPREFVGVYADC